MHSCIHIRFSVEFFVPNSLLACQISRKGLSVVLYRPQLPPSSAVTASSAAGLVQGLLSSVVYAMYSGRVVLVDWPEITLAKSLDLSELAFHPLQETLQSDFQQLRSAFGLDDGSKRFNTITQADASPQWLCATDLQALDNNDILSFNSANNFMGWAEYVVSSRLQQTDHTLVDLCVIERF